MLLTTERLHLRPVMLADTDALFRIYGDPATNLFNPAGPFPDIGYAQQVMTQWLHHWQMNNFGNFAITLCDIPDHVIGFGGLSVRSYESMTINNLGYRFATEAWGQGLATEFAGRLLPFGFDMLELADIFAVVRQHHLASQRVLEKIGLRQVGEVHDVPNAPSSLVYRLTQDEWRQANDKL